MAKVFTSQTFPVPIELRMEIFRLCFNVGRIVPFPEPFLLIKQMTGDIPVPRPGDEQTHSLKPFIQLLRVSRSIRNEAEAVLYGDNLFALQSRGAVQAFLKMLVMNCNDRRHLVGCVELQLTRSSICEDKAVEYKAQVRWATFVATELDFEGGEEDPSAARARKGRNFNKSLHRVVKMQHHDVNWPRIIDPVLSGLPNIRRLELDLRQCWCGSGCCHVQSMCLDAFRGSFVHGVPQVIKIDGLRGFRSEPGSSTVADMLVRSMFEYWRNGENASELDRKLGIEGEEWLKREMQAEVDDDGRW